MSSPCIIYKYEIVRIKTNIVRGQYDKYNMLVMI